MWTEFGCRGLKRLALTGAAALLLAQPARARKFHPRAPRKRQTVSARCARSFGPLQGPPLTPVEKLGPSCLRRCPAA